MQTALSSNRLLSLVLLAQIFDIASSFAVSSSSSPKRKKVTNQGKAPAGFGKKDDAVPTTHTKDESKSTQNLIDFLLRWKSDGLMGGDSGTEVGYDMTTNMRGVYAHRPFKKNEIICKIPSDCALAVTDPNAEMALEGGSMSEADIGLNFLKWYQNNDEARKTWSAYLDTLPTRDENFDPTPDFYSDEEVEELELPMMVKAVNERKNQISELSQSEGISFDELQFATWMVTSRSFAIKIMVDDPLAKEGAVSTTEKMVRVLLPYIDIINHSSDDSNAELEIIDPDKDDAWFAVRATRPIKKGKEITISYGTSPLASPGLLLDYGFVPEENKIDSWMISKGGEGSIESLDGWRTTLEEDEAQLSQAAGNMVNILKLRTKLKRAYK